MPPNKNPKLARVCRICLSAKSENSVILSDDSDWTRLYQYCFNISVNENGPNIACEECSKKLTEFSDFKTLALKSDSIWNNVLNSVVKKDDTIIEPIVIKDESSDHEDKYTENVDYLDSDWQPDEPLEAENVKIEKRSKRNKNKVLKQDSDVVQDKVNAEEPQIDDNSAECFTQNKFIQEYFEVLKLQPGKHKASYECLKCGDEIKRKSTLPSHVQKCYDIQVVIDKESSKPEKVREEPSVFYCGICEHKGPDETEVTKHFSEHCANNDLNCKLCDYVGRDLADVVYHRYKHMPDEFKNRVSACPSCDKKIRNPLIMQFHYRSVHLNKSGGWCSVCNKVFNGYKYFRNHERLHFTDTYTCDYCGHKFLFKNGLVQHMRDQHLNIRNFVCDTCGKAFKRNNALTYHIRAHHVNNKPVPCSHCGKKFKNDYSLKMHMKMVKREKTYICDICSKAYPVLNLLQKHMFRHTGQKPYACETCGMSYKSKQYLQIHMRKHTGDFPYKCDSCEKQFISSTQLRNHSGVHTGIHRVKCLVCEKTFRERKQMLAHCQTKHESVIVKLENQGNALVVT